MEFDTLTGWPLRSVSVGSLSLRICEDVNAGPGGRLWDGGHCLANYIQSQFSATHFNGLNVLELGAGVGLPGIVCALLGASLTLTDRKQYLNLLQRNVDLNLTGETLKQVSINKLDWGQNVKNF